MAEPGQLQQDAGQPLTFAEDPWQHRSTGMRCRTCVFFVVKVAEPSTVAHESAFGRCRRRAPTLNGFPAVFDHDWCGDHRLDENKR